MRPEITSHFFRLSDDQVGADGPSPILITWACILIIQHRRQIQILAPAYIAVPHRLMYSPEKISTYPLYGRILRFEFSLPIHTGYDGSEKVHRRRPDHQIAEKWKLFSGLIYNCLPFEPQEPEELRRAYRYYFDQLQLLLNGANVCFGAPAFS